ncbi:hypothetical protein BDK51DRAFT_11863, partial [Blyttiomyces helicus]
KGRPVIAANGLSITERIFYASKPGRPQVVMGIMIRLRPPPTLSPSKFTVTRIIDLLRLAAASHYRLISYIDPQTMLCHRLGNTVADFHLPHRIVPRGSGEDSWRNEATWETVFREEINRTFDTSDTSKPLWRVALIVPPEMMEGEGERRVGRVEGGALRPYVELMHTFHHCLGDGLSMFSFSRSFLDLCDKERFDVEDLKLGEVELTTVPPPVLDNLVNPSVFEVLPVATGMAFRFLSGKRHRKFKGRVEGEAPPTTTSTAPTEQKPLMAAPSTSVSTASLPTAVPIPRPLTNPTSGTLTRFLWFDSDFISALRKKSKSEGTTIAAVLVVNALAAVRSTYATWDKYRRKPLPSRQGWVVTNSVRHMLPGSRLIHGADKQSDPASMVFGGYSGSVMNANLHLSDTHAFWERARVVRRAISKCLRSSIARLKLVNYVYRHPKLWAYVNSKADLAKMSRAYSVEVANLGAWDYPAALPTASPSDTRARLEHFAGVVNSSFDGVRGLFTLGVITLAGNMSIAVAYDASAVSEEDADVFVGAFAEGLRRVKEAEGRISIMD